ncbi:MAG: DUF3313 family protein [Gammaproteobacteria bacterium]|nr:DUF3313 family protein [Gammaproteobacteria bacterium]
MNNTFKMTLIAGMTVLATACSTLEPTVRSGPGSYVSPDGLNLVENSKMDVVLVKPGLDLGQYDSIMVAPVSIAYKRGSYELTDDQQREMIETFDDVTRDVLGSGQYHVAQSAGNNVLIANVKLVDLYVNVPTVRSFSVGRTRMFTANSGEISVVGELRDSVTGELLVQFADRSQPRTYWARSTEVSEWAEVRTAFRFWANVLKNRLDSFHGQHG